MQSSLPDQRIEFTVMHRFLCSMQTYPHKRSALVDPSSFDVVVVNTVVTFHWLRHQVEAWGLSFLRKAVW